jgi:polyphosphate kinase
VALHQRERNLDRRVEALCPIVDPSIRDDIGRTLLGTYLRNDTLATTLRADGRYEPIARQADSADPQEVLMSMPPPEWTMD